MAPPTRGGELNTYENIPLNTAIAVSEVLPQSSLWSLIRIIEVPFSNEFPAGKECSVSSASSNLFPLLFSPQGEEDSRLPSLAFSALLLSSTRGI